MDSTMFDRPNFRALHQPNNFEDAFSPDDMPSFLHNSSKNIVKLSSWHSFLSAEAIGGKKCVSENASPSDTPLGSPHSNRKQLANMRNMTNSFEQLKSKRWFNPQILPPLQQATSDQNGTSSANEATTHGSFTRKSNSYKNVSNFDINAVGPISF